MASTMGDDRPRDAACLRNDPVIPPPTATSGGPADRHRAPPSVSARNPADGWSEWPRTM